MSTQGLRAREIMRGRGRTCRYSFNMRKYVAMDQRGAMSVREPQHGRQHAMDSRPRARLQGCALGAQRSCIGGTLQKRRPFHGLHLRNALAKEMVVLGFVFREGSFQAVDGGPQKKGLIRLM